MLTHFVPYIPIHPASITFLTVLRNNNSTIPDSFNLIKM
jgi:hypothetical protein